MKASQARRYSISILSLSKWSLSALVSLLVPALIAAQSPTSSPVIVQLQTAPKGTMDHILGIVQIVTFFINILALVGLYLYVRKTKELADHTSNSVYISEHMLEEMKASRAQEIAPFVIVYVDMPNPHNWMLYFNVKNIGRSVAKDITLAFDPPIKTGFGNRIRDFDPSFVRDGILSLAPQQQLSTPYDSVSNLFGEAAKELDEPLPLFYKVQVSFGGGLSDDRVTAQHVIDLSMFRNVSFLEEITEQDYFRAVQSIASSVSYIRGSVHELAGSVAERLWIRNDNLSRTLISDDDWRQAMRDKLEQLKTLVRIYGNVKVGNAFHFPSADVRSSLSSLVMDILTCASKSPSTNASLLTDIWTDVIQKANEVRGHFRGGDFWDMTDRVSAACAELLDQIDRALIMLEPLDVAPPHAEGTEPI